MIAWLLLIAAPEPIALRLEEVGELPLAEGIAIADALSTAIRERTGRPVVLDEPSWACGATDRCIAEIQARARATSVVMLRVFGGATLIHLRAERIDGPPGLELNLQRSRDDWAAAMSSAASAMFPEPRIQAIPLAPPPPIAVEAGPPIVPIVLFASAAVLAGVGLGFGISSDGAATQISAEPLGATRYQALSDRQSAHGIVADTCFAVAGGALVGAVVTWLWPEP